MPPYQATNPSNWERAPRGVLTRMRHNRHLGVGHDGMDFAARGRDEVNLAAATEGTFEDDLDASGDQTGPTASWHASR